MMNNFEMDQIMTAWLICFNVFVLYGLVRCNQTVPSTPIDNASTTSNNKASTTSLYNTSTTSPNNSSSKMAAGNEFSRELIMEEKFEARKLFLVSSPKQDGFSLHLKLATDQVYFLDYKVSSICSKQIRNISKGIHRGDMWALTFLDSNGQQPVFQTTNIVHLLGSAEQCESISIRGSDNEVITGRYAMMNLMPSGIDQKPVDPYITWYLCLPTSCSNNDFKSMATTFQMSFGIHVEDITKTKIERPPKNHWFYIAIVCAELETFSIAITLWLRSLHWLPINNWFSYKVTLSTLAFICLLATGIDCLYTYCLTPNALDKEIIFNQQEEEESISLETMEDGVMKRKQSFYLDRCRRILLAFSLRRNLNDILKTSSSEGDIGCLHGLRVLSMMWVIFGHVGNILPNFRDPKQAERNSKTAYVILSFSAPYAVDSFFLFSGCLVSYLFIKTVNRVGQFKPIHMVMYYIHRYIRLTPLFLLVIIIFAGVLPYIVPSKYALKYTYNCDRYWWRNILYINNLFKNKDICLPWSWYLSADMQFYVIAPLVTVPIVYGFYKFGLIIAFLMLVCHIGTSTYVIEVQRTPENREYFDYMTNLYIKPWTRIGPHAMGLILGYFLSVWPKEFRIKKMVIVLGWLTCTGVGLSLVITQDYSTKTSIDIIPTLTTPSKRVFEIFKSPLWAACVTWVILACHYGYGGILNTFLNWKAWKPLSKLTYGTYLCHLVILEGFNFTLDYGIDVSKFYLVERLVLITILTYIMSLILSLMIEIPTRNMLNTSKKSLEIAKDCPLAKEEKTENKGKTIK